LFSDVGRASVFQRNIEILVSSFIVLVQPMIKSRTFTVDRLRVQVFPDRLQAGTFAAAAAAQSLRAAISRRGAARIIVASAPSQNELLAGLGAAAEIDWSRVTIFHLDEYVGLPEDHSASFRNYQRRTSLARVTPSVFHGIRGESPDSDAECARYSSLLAEAPIDLACMGIGENGHIAFNDPGVANFEDPAWVKIVKLDQICRQQQVNEGCFPNINAVPTTAITLTCPAIMSAQTIICVVPGARKAAAVAATLNGPVAAACPASVLRTHPSTTLFLDSDSVARIVGNLS
jgi:glucosamine-6-phosphate deaminase